MSVRDRDHWRSVRKSLMQAMQDRGLIVPDREGSLITRFLLESLEEKGIFLVPLKPTRKMNQASRHALDVGRRLNERWVSVHEKHRQRLVAAIEAAPDWRVGMTEDQSDQERAAFDDR